MTLRELAVACYIYKILAKDFDNNDPHEQFRQATGNSPDLSDKKHIKALLEFLRKFGCRHINRNSPKEIEPYKKIADWYNEYCKELPQEKERLWDLKEEKLESFGKLHNTLAKLKVVRRKDGVEVKMGIVGAAKALSAIRPNVFPPWDNAIRGKLKDSYLVKSYADYLKYVKKVILDLKETCKIHNINIDNLPQNLDRPKSTVAKLIDEYLWVTITNGFDVEEIVRRWDKWTKSQNKQRKQK